VIVECWVSVAARDGGGVFRRQADLGAAAGTRVGFGGDRTGAAGGKIVCDVGVAIHRAARWATVRARYEARGWELVEEQCGLDDPEPETEPLPPTPSPERRGGEREPSGGRRRSAG